MRYKSKNVQQKTDEAKKMAGLIKRLRKFDSEKRPHGQRIVALRSLAEAVGDESPMVHYHWLKTGQVPNLKVPLLDAFLSKGGY